MLKIKRKCSIFYGVEKRNSMSCSVKLKKYLKMNLRKSEPRQIANDEGISE